MKFLADVGISMSTVRALREWGYDAVHLREQGLQRLPDPEILKKAAAEGRAVASHLVAMSRMIPVWAAQGLLGASIWVQLFERKKVIRMLQSRVPGREKKRGQATFHDRPQ